MASLSQWQSLTQFRLMSDCHPRRTSPLLRGTFVGSPAGSGQTQSSSFQQLARPFNPTHHFRRWSNQPSTLGRSVAVGQLELPLPPAGIFLRIERARPKESNGIGAPATPLSDCTTVVVLAAKKGKRGRERTSAPAPKGVRRAAYCKGSLRTPGPGPTGCPSHAMGRTL